MKRTKRRLPKDEDNSPGWVVKGVRSVMDDVDWKRWLTPGERGTWNTSKRPRGLVKGAPVFFFKGSPDSVLVAEARLTGLVRKDDTQFFIGTETVRVFEEPLAQELLRADFALKAASFLQVGPAGTFFPLTVEQVRRIQELAGVAGVAEARAIRWAFFLGSGVPESDYAAGTRLALPRRALTAARDLAVLVIPRRGVVALLEITGARGAECFARVLALPSSPISRADALDDEVLKDWNVAKRNMVAPTNPSRIETSVARRLEALLTQRGAGLPPDPDNDSRTGRPKVEAASDTWEPTNANDARERELRSIALRKGQPAFRQALLGAYKGLCAITGCDAQEALEAAHILPYDGPSTNHVQNGLLLRADMHTLFDLGEIQIDPDRLIVQISSRLMTTVYREFHGQKLRVPSSREHQPSVEAFRRRAASEAKR